MYVNGLIQIELIRSDFIKKDNDINSKRESKVILTTRVKERRTQTQCMNVTQTRPPKNDGSGQSQIIMAAWQDNALAAALGCYGMLFSPLVQLVSGITAVKLFVIIQPFDQCGSVCVCV